MERLFVKDFLVIKHAEFDVGRINVIIGPQASGKSVLAKLLYFFREFLQAELFQSVRAADPKPALERKCQDVFERYFPPYTWAGTTFEIEYIIHNQFIRVANNSANGLNVTYSPELERFRREWIDDLRGRRIATPQDSHLDERGLTDSFEWVKSISPANAALGKCFNPSLFVPAGRSFFANIQNNIFGLLENNIAIDPFLRNFGARLEFARNAFQHLAPDRKTDEFAHIRERGLSFWEPILCGKYVRDDGQDWISSGDSKTNLAYASSGQQEVLPLLLTVLFWPLAFRFADRTTLFIEEPEAHLFPTAQKTLLEFFSSTYNGLQHSYVLTTHSPYILTAINNLILARDVFDANPAQSIENMPESDLHIAYEDVRAYTIKDGELLSIMDDEIRLIGASVIDEVSDAFDTVFDTLLQHVAER